MDGPMIVIHRQLVLTAFLVISLFSAPLYAAEPEKSDTRILIDISGSMKKNDPDNLRRSALRLLVGLMPQGNRAGVWTFAQYTNMLVPLGVINDSWKRKARHVSERIASPGQFTNIEDVIKRATADWKGESALYRKNIILLTDGMVDIAKDATSNAASRNRIVEELLPVIKAAGAKIHTIALSDRADHELMKMLSGQTGGWYEQVNSADELQRVFLRMFEKVGQPDAVPLTGNKFQLDSSINEATLLLFAREGAKPASIIKPDGTKFDAMQPPGNVSWHRDEGYDLVTIKKPAAGEWTIQADMDPDNRVMVVTDLKMKTTDIPHRLALGESIPVSVHFTEKGSLVTERAFIEVVNVSAVQLYRGEEGETRPLYDDGNAPDEKAGDGRFGFSLGEGLDEGKVELVINADGKTFVRQRRQAAQIVHPGMLQVEDNAATTTAKLRINMDEEVVDKDSVAIEAWLEDLEGNRTTLEFARPEEGGFAAGIDKEKLPGRHFVMINVSGKTVSGNDFNYQPQAVDVDGLAKPLPPEPEPVVEQQPEPVVEPEKKVAEDREPEPEAEAEPQPVAEAGEDWLIPGLVIGLGNLLLIGIGVGVWLFMRKREPEEEVFFLDDEETGSEASAETKTSAQDDAVDISTKEDK